MSESAPLQTLEVLCLVALGGFAGANLRHAFALAIPGLGGTLAANVLGCLALGVVVYEAELAGVLARETRYAVATGFLASFTTYSTFALEVIQSPTPAGLTYVGATYALGFAAVLLGRRLARILAGVAG
ncbi:CrcB protein [Haloplanus vescus]|uniref:Fluoride-specific ion channel FluC n=1 Tax=Haloplanus vescus TaxID=555874 RepID=A0A1H3WME4_9EURY|nr:CrcB family protein [Haloplanus vescus]SDZ87981.1 CrcB protein [Haloplanus vescus]